MVQTPVASVAAVFGHCISMARAKPYNHATMRSGPDEIYRSTLRGISENGRCQLALPSMLGFSFSMEKMLVEDGPFPL